MKMKIHTLQDREVFYESVFDNMLDGLAYCQMLFDTQGQPIDFLYVAVNKNFEKLTGLRDAVGKKVTELIPGIKASNPELFEIYGRVSLTGKPERFETYVKPLLRWFFVSVYSPKKKFFVAVFQDVTGRKHIEEELKNARIASQNVLEDLQVEKEKLVGAKAKDEAILASIGDGMIATGKDGNIIIMNHKAEMLLGGATKDFLGKQLHEVLYMYDDKDTVVPFEKRPIQVALTTGKTTTTTTTYYYERKDGLRFPVAITVNPIILNKDIVGAVEIFRDITREREIDKAKTEFVYLASHELRTPLTAIDGIASMIRNGEYGEVNSNLKQPLEDINTSSERLIHLVNNLLNLARMQSGRLKYRLSEIDIKPIIEGVVSLLQIIAKPKGLRLSTADIDSVSVLTDVDKLEHILDNVIGNALKFTDKGSVTVSTHVVDDKVEVYITDTGIGIAKEYQEKLFGKFEQLGSSLGRPAGTGLGLHISRELIRKMGGDVWLEKSEPNVGSTFVLSIPLPKSEAAKNAEKEIKKEAKEDSDQKYS